MVYTAVSQNTKTKVQSCCSGFSSATPHAEPRNIMEVLEWGVLFSQFGRIGKTIQAQSKYSPKKSSHTLQSSMGRLTIPYSSGTLHFHHKQNVTPGPKPLPLCAGLSDCTGGCVGMFWAASAFQEVNRSWPPSCVVFERGLLDNQ